MTTSTPAVPHLDIDARIDAYIAADPRLARDKPQDFHHAPAEWRGGASIAAWRALNRAERRRRVRALIAGRLGLELPAEPERSAARPTQPARAAVLRGYVVSCADGCGEFAPASGPRPVLRYMAGHGPRRTS